MSRLFLSLLLISISSAMAFKLMKNTPLVKRQSLSMSPLAEVVTNSVLPGNIIIFVK